jgi:hypothetical protein
MIRGEITITPKEFATYVRYKTRTNSTTFTDTDILALMKVRQDELARNILDTDEDILLIPQTTDLVEDQRLYAFPSDILSRIKRVEAKPDGENWLRFVYTDINDLKYPVTENNITIYFSNNEGNCKYDIYRKSLYLLCGPISSVSDGLKVWTMTYPAPITDLSDETDMSEDPSTTTHGIPRELHEIWARGVIIDYKESREKPLPLTEREIKYEFDKNNAIHSLKYTDLSRTITAKIPYEDGTNF